LVTKVFTNWIGLGGIGKLIFGQGKVPLPGFPFGQNYWGIGFQLPLIGVAKILKLRAIIIFPFKIRRHYLG